MGDLLAEGEAASLRVDPKDQLGSMDGSGKDSDERMTARVVKRHEVSRGG
jgi:hypothetical protein